MGYTIVSGNKLSPVALHQNSIYRNALANPNQLKSTTVLHTCIE